MTCLNKCLIAQSNFCLHVPLYVPQSSCITGLTNQNLALAPARVKSNLLLPVLHSSMPCTCLSDRCIQKVTESLTTALITIGPLDLNLHLTHLRDLWTSFDFTSRQIKCTPSVSDNSSMSLIRYGGTYSCTYFRSARLCSSCCRHGHHKSNSM